MYFPVSFRKEGVSLSGEESLQRARKRNPFRASGRLARGAEHVPFLNNVMQGLHRVTGKSEELRRARRKNPLGANGYVTKLGEHIPGLADTICCIHKFRGLDAEAERARAFSLHRMVGRQGAITHLAQLLPGTNLIAALLAEAKGDRKEAIKAMNLLKSWRDVASADGALARVAELLPGVDIISFGLMVNHGHFAHAVRAICKTRWVDVTAKSSTLTLSTGCVEDWVVQSVDSDVIVQPRATSLASGLVDVFIHLLDFDQHGNQRWVTRGLEEHELPSACARKKRRGLRRAFEDVKIMKANQAIHGMLDYLFLSSPHLLGFLTELTNWAVYEWTASSFSSRCTLRAFAIFFPPMICRRLRCPTAPSEGLARAVQNSLPGVTTTHGQMPVNPSNFQIPLNVEEQSILPSVCAGASCISLSCFASMHSFLLPLACFTGCFAGVSFLRRTIHNNLTRWINQFNAESWKSMSSPVVPLARQIEQSEELPPESILEWAIKEKVSESFNEIFEPQGVTFEWSRRLLEEVRFAELLRNYVLHEWFSRRRALNWLHPAVWIMQFLECPLRGHVVLLHFALLRQGSQWLRWYGHVRSTRFYRSIRPTIRAKCQSQGTIASIAGTSSFMNCKYWCYIIMSQPLESTSQLSLAEWTKVADSSRKSQIPITAVSSSYKLCPWQTFWTRPSMVSTCRWPLGLIIISFGNCKHYVTTTSVESILSALLHFYTVL